VDQQVNVGLAGQRFGQDQIALPMAIPYSVVVKGLYQPSKNGYHVIDGKGNGERGTRY
jgi:hypothetical protein